MSNDSSSYVNSNSHDSAMIMKLLQQSKQTTSDICGSNIRHVEIPNNISDEYYWYYLDPKNNIQGPFHDSQMFQWWSQGIYFQNSLMIKRKADSEFSTLQDYSKRFNGVPFNRKDIRVPPLTESLSSSNRNNFIGSKLYGNGLVAFTHPHMQQPSQINDPSMLLQMFSSGSQNVYTDEVVKLLQKVNLQNRGSNSLDHLHSLPLVQNGSDSYFYNEVSNSLSSYVKPNFSNQYQHSQAECKNLPMDSYTKHDSFPGQTWGSNPQTNLMDSVWTSQVMERIPSSQNAVWSQSNNDLVQNRPMTLTNINQDTKLKQTTAKTDLHQPNPMQDSWDNLDPAIIKMVPSVDHPVHSINSNVHKDILSPTQRTPPTENPINRLHSENVKSAWAEMVRKPTSNCQKYKSGCNSENDIFTNHSVSPNQKKTSLTSNSSDENDHQQSESSDKDLESLITWCKNYLENKPGLNSVDISTLVELLSLIESPYEVEAMVRENIPDFDNIGDFVKVFLEKRRPLRLKIASDSQKKKSKSPPKVEESTKWQVKSKSQGSTKKKRKNNKN